jgi:hypothetical protein
VKVASAQLLSGVDPACSSTPKPFRWIASRVAVIELTASNTTPLVVVGEIAIFRENSKDELHRNTALQFLNLKASALGSVGLAEIAPVLYRNASIKALVLTNNGLHDIEAANALRELIHRNMTITSPCIADNAFGRNAAAVRSILDGVRSNTTLQQLDLGYCGVDDQGISLLANALAIRNASNASNLELNLDYNEITSVGVRAMIDNNVEAMKTLTRLCLYIATSETKGRQF